MAGGTYRMAEVGIDLWVSYDPPPCSSRVT